MVLILFTLQTSKIFSNLLPAQNYLSITYNGEMRICFYYYPADILAVWKCSAAKNETQKSYYIDIVVLHYYYYRGWNWGKKREKKISEESSCCLQSLRSTVDNYRY